MTSVRRFAVVVLALVAFAHAAWSAPIPPTIQGNELTARIELVGGVAADLTITFEQVVGLNPSALAINATLINPLDAALLARLPSGVSIPSGFPVLVDIQAPPSSALTFSGTYRLSLYTQNLTLTSPLRLFRGGSTGPFADMTGFLEVGSVRAGGTGPGYSQFLIVFDPRPLDPVIAAKFDAVAGLLTTHAAAMPPAVLSALQQQLAAARTAYESGNTNNAINGIAAFGTGVKDQSGSAIPDVWQANSAAVVNVAGLLRSAADTLKFSLMLKANVGS